jgi:Bacterial cell division membrane protein
MAEFAQTAINKINQFYQQWVPKLPAEVNPRNVLIFCVLALLCIGSIMVASASMPYAERMHENAFHYVTRHAISILVAAGAAFLAYKVPLKVWFNNTFFLWIITIVLLVAVLFVGTEVNGSKRWIRVAGFTLQASKSPRS